VVGTAFAACTLRYVYWGDHPLLAHKANDEIAITTVTAMVRLTLPDALADVYHKPDAMSSGPSVTRARHNESGPNAKQMGQIGLHSRERTSAGLQGEFARGSWWDGGTPNDRAVAFKGLRRRQLTLHQMGSLSASSSTSTSSPVTVKITRSQILVTRSAVRSRLCATHIKRFAWSITLGSLMI